MTAPRGLPARGQGRGCRLAAALAAVLLWPAVHGQADSGFLEVRFYFSPECGSCARFIGSDVPRLETLLGVKIALVLRDIQRPGVLDELRESLADRGLSLTVVPVLIAGDTVLVGSREIELRFESVARRMRDAPRDGPLPGGDPQSR